MKCGGLFAALWGMYAGGAFGWLSCDCVFGLSPSCVGLAYLLERAGLSITWGGGAGLSPSCAAGLSLALCIILVTTVLFIFFYHDPVPNYLILFTLIPITPSMHGCSPLLCPHCFALIAALTVI